MNLQDYVSPFIKRRVPLKLVNGHDLCARQVDNNPLNTVGQISCLPDSRHTFVLPPFNSAAKAPFPPEQSRRIGPLENGIQVRPCSIAELFGAIATEAKYSFIAVVLVVHGVEPAD